MCTTYGDLFARFLGATREFNVSMGQPDNVPFSEDLMSLRLKLIEEEAKELDYELMEASNRVRETGKIERPTAMQIVKESSDLIYVLAGTAATFGLRYVPEDKNQVFDTNGHSMSLICDKTKFFGIDMAASYIRYNVLRVLYSGHGEGLKGFDVKRFTVAIEDATAAVIELADDMEFPLLDAFNAVHASNMSKLGDDGKPVYREDGKVMKGPNYHKPDMSVFVEQEEDD